MNRRTIAKATAEPSTRSCPVSTLDRRLPRSLSVVATSVLHATPSQLTIMAVKKSRPRDEIETKWVRLTLDLKERPSMVVAYTRTKNHPTTQTHVSSACVGIRVVIVFHHGSVEIAHMLMKRMIKAAQESPKVANKAICSPRCSCAGCGIRLEGLLTIFTLPAHGSPAHHCFSRSFHELTQLTSIYIMKISSTTVTASVDAVRTLASRYTSPNMPFLYFAVRGRQARFTAQPCTCTEHVHTAKQRPGIHVHLHDYVVCAAASGRHRPKLVGICSAT